MYIAPLAKQMRIPTLLELTNILAKEMQGVSRFAQSLAIDKAKHPDEFESVLFDFLIPLHQALIQTGAWDEALALETIAYSNYIKQEEDHDFYERAFSGLYAPYTLDIRKPTSSDSLVENGATLFWLQNYVVLAHTQLMLDLAAHLPQSTKRYASALSNTQMNESRAVFSQAGVEILSIDDRQSISSRCHELMQICKVHGISNIVFVSTPLQSGFIKTISSGIQLTWWSMKYPLGCMSHFDRLVCNRAMRPTQKNFHGAIWHCAPFAVKALEPHCSRVPMGAAESSLKLGVLSREEKFASSPLPEVLSQCLLTNSEAQLFWTGRHQDPELDHRLHAQGQGLLQSRVHFCGWVDPAAFLTQMDLLIDTPNLGGMVAYWMMSIGKVVISATDSGSVGALGTREELDEHFDLLSTVEDIDAYFSSSTRKPYYLSDVHLIPHCVTLYANQRHLLQDHGKRFARFFSDSLSDIMRWSHITYQMLQGQSLK